MCVCNLKQGISDSPAMRDMAPYTGYQNLRPARAEHVILLSYKAVTFLRLVQLERLRVSRDWDWMRTCASLGQPYRSRCASFGHAVVGDRTALLRLLEPRSSCK